MEPRISHSKLVLDFFEEEKIEGEINNADMEERAKELKEVTPSMNNQNMKGIIYNYQIAQQSSTAKEGYSQLYNEIFQQLYQTNMT